MSSLELNNILSGTSQNYRLNQVFRIDASTETIVIETNGNRTIVPLKLAETRNPAVLDANAASDPAVAEIPLVDQINALRYQDEFLCQCAVEYSLDSVGLKSLAAGSALPAGVVFDPANCGLDGIPTEAGVFTFTIKVRDTANPEDAVGASTLRSLWKRRRVHNRRGACPLISWYGHHRC